MERISESLRYLIQADESSKADKKTIMLVSVHCIFQEYVQEDILCAVLSPSNTTARELFKSLNDYILGKLNWSFGWVYI